MTVSPSFGLVSSCALEASGAPVALRLPAYHLVTHGVVVGMTGSGKTGLLTVMIEEALQQGIPTLVVDVKGDLPTLLLAFPSFGPKLVAPWMEQTGNGADGPPVSERARQFVKERQRALEGW